MKKLFWIRTGLLLILLIFAVLGGNFLYTGAESASPLDMAADAVPLNAEQILVQTFSPEHARVTAVSLALQPPGSPASELPDSMSDASGTLTVTLSDHATGAQIYSSTVSMAGVPDSWYIDFPVNCRLDTEAQYDLSLYAGNYQEGMNPSLYCVPQSAQIPEITASLAAFSRYGDDSAGAADTQTDGSSDSAGTQADGSSDSAGTQNGGSSDSAGTQADGSTDSAGTQNGGSSDSAGTQADGSADSAGTQNGGSAGSGTQGYPSGAAAIRLTYDVLVPFRLVLFLMALVLILLCAAGTVFFSRKKSDTAAKDITPGKFLSVRIRGISLIHILFFTAVTAAAVLVRIAFLPVKSNDYYLCFESWIMDMRSSGVLSALGQNIGDYPPLYVTPLTLLSLLPFEPVIIIKLMPCLFDFILALVCVKLSKQLGVTTFHRKLLLYAVILLNPLTLLDSAAWGQCDSLYGSFILLTLLAVCGAKPWNTESPAKGRHVFWTSGDGIFLLFALAFSLKLQAVFFFPVLCLLWITQKRNVIKPVQLLWVPIVYTVSCIPMYLAGRSLKIMFKIYWGQANRNYGTLTLNYPNLYHLIGTWSEELYDSYFIYGILLAVLLLITLFYQLYCRKIKLDSLMLCKVTALSILTICFCMPLIHERYAYTAEILLFVIMIREAKHIKTALVTMLCTLFTYCTYLMQLEQSFSVLPEQIIALIRLGVIFYLTADIFQSKNQKTEKNTITDSTRKQVSSPEA